MREVNNYNLVLDILAQATEDYYDTRSEVKIQELRDESKIICIGSNAHTMTNILTKVIPLDYVTLEYFNTEESGDVKLILYTPN